MDLEQLRELLVLLREEGVAKYQGPLPTRDGSCNGAIEFLGPAHPGPHHVLPGPVAEVRVPDSALPSAQLQVTGQKQHEDPDRSRRVSRYEEALRGPLPQFKRTPGDPKHPANAPTE